MPSVRDVLEVFGALDQAIIDSGDPAVSAAADRILPGSSSNTGWYQELEHYIFGAKARTKPDLVAALNRIADADTDADASDPARIGAPLKARLLYGISAAARLKHVAPGCSLPSFAQPAGTGFDDAVLRALAVIGPSEHKLRARRIKAKQSAADFMRNVSTTFTRPQDFDAVRAQAADSIRFKKPLAAPLCDTSVARVNDYESVVIDTKFRSDTLSLERLKAIVNPFNWDEDYPNFFTGMKEQQQPLLPDGWRRVLEQVRLIGALELRTPLKFFPYQDPQRPFEASLQYDLDTAEFGTGDGNVLVDRGYINLTAVNTTRNPKQPGVRVVTRKVVHIKDISPFAQARLVCIGGYGTQSADFLLGSAENPPPKPKPFDFPANAAQAATDEPAAAAPQSSTVHFAPAAVGAWTEAVQDMTNGYFDIAEKWLTGGLTVADVADYSKRVGSGLAGAPWKYLQEMTTPRPPGGQGGGT